MDGTLTLPVLDFKGMLKSLNLAPGTDILPTVQKYSPQERAKAMAIIEEYEVDGLQRMQVRAILTFLPSSLSLFSLTSIYLLPVTVHTHVHTHCNTCYPIVTTWSVGSATLSR